MTSYFGPIVRKEKGFTLIEIMVVFSVIAILSSVGIAASVNYSRAQTLESATQDLKAMLNQAKSYAQSQYKPVNCNDSVLEKYTVEINKTTKDYVLYAICGGSQEIARNELPKEVIFSSEDTTVDSFDYPIFKGGIQGIQGNVPVPSPWTIRIVSNVDNSKYKIITVNSSGSIR